MIEVENLAFTEEIISGKVYMVEMQNGETNSFLVLSETPTHYIFSFTTDETVEVVEKAKKEVIGIYDVKEWWNSKGER
jgi:hypothetical protein